MQDKRSLWVKNRIKLIWLLSLLLFERRNKTPASGEREEKKTRNNIIRNNR